MPLLLLLSCLSAPTAGAQPVLYSDGVVNAASFLSPSVPGGAIAKGSIFTIFGESLGATFEAEQFPLPTTLGGAEVWIATADGDNFRAPLLYVSANQVNAILPSTVPAGRHQLWLVRDGQSSGGVAIKVVEASGGLFSWKAQGIPVAAAYAYLPFLQKLISLETPAQPGDAVSLYGTGLGPVAGPDDQPPPAAPSGAAIEVLLAGHSIPFTYAGRSSCCAGLDQINIEIPADAPAGCVVPLAVRVNGNVSNHVSLPISPDGAACDPTAAFRQGRLTFTRQWNGDVPADQSLGQFDWGLDPLDPTRLPPAGSCMVWPEAGVPGPSYFDATTFIEPKKVSDAGSAITLSTPAGEWTLSGLFYSTLEPAASSFLGVGAYAASAPGGDQFPAFEAQLQVNPAPVLEDFSPANVFARSTGANVRWFGGDQQARGFAASGKVVCGASVGDGRFEVPAYVWADQPSGERLFTFGAIQSAEMQLPTDGPDHGLLVYREQFARGGDLGPPYLAATPVQLPSGATIQAELAATAAERARGLMFRPVLDSDKGMLFVFETSNVYRFWMLNTLVPLDILWMNEDREVQFISADTPPCQTQVCPTYGPNQPSRYVLELAAGEAQRRGLTEGDVLEW
ncbi:MAG: DUF192 domain-containing protein [Bryobacterales bacterium]|nr:DUF192 domain-containing protein [Bryobacterales bacterium]